MTRQYRWRGAELELHGTGLSLCWRGLVVQADCDWLQLIRPSAWNWLNFRLVGLAAEWNRSMGSVEGDVSLLGFSLRASVTYADTELRAELRRRVAEMLE